MFIELVELGKRIRKGHDALAPCQCDYDIIINKNGEFLKLLECDCQLVSEYIPSTAKNGKARLLLDKAEETLAFEGIEENGSKQEVNGNFEEDGYTDQKRDGKKRDPPLYKKKHTRYLDKLNEYKELSVLTPIFSFYSKPQEVEKALNKFKTLPKSKQKGNMTFMVDGNYRPLSLDCVLETIKKKYDEKVSTSVEKNVLCSVCGKSDYPIIEEPHGGITLPGSDKKCSLVSYNNPSFLSYNLKRNINSGICQNCARNYVGALDYITKSEWTTSKNGKKFKVYENAIELSDDTLITFWTKEPNDDVDPFSDIYQPKEERVKNLFSSIAFGDKLRVDTDVENFFYCCTLSSSAARIAVRDWISISISQYQKNLKQWFEDIATLKEGKVYYPGINVILNNCIKKKKESTQSDFKAKARIGTMLWHAALTNTSLPVMILQSVLGQIEHGSFVAEESTVIRLVLNRNPKKTYQMKKELDEENESKAYLCGRLFALICKLQFVAQGAVNSSIKDRFFASASNMPAKVMGLLLSKYVPIYEKKAKGAYSKSITEVAARIGHFPDKFSIVERGEFALGYYYQDASKHNENNNEEE